MELHQIVLKLTGRVTPVADASIDKERLENFKDYTELFLDMFNEITWISENYEDSPCASAKEIGQRAENILRVAKE